MASSRSDQGFVLIVTCIVLAILLALAGLGIDIGRMYVIQSELQAFSDAAALPRFSGMAPRVASHALSKPRPNLPPDRTP